MQSNRFSCFPFPALQLVRTCALLFACLPAAALALDEAPASPGDDGPYVFRIEGQQLESLWLCDGEVVRQVQPDVPGATVSPRCGFPHPAVIPPQDDLIEAELPEGARIVALSDIHGQYDLMVRLLRAHGVIDEDDHWSLGRDHLVIAGDIFDRGSKVTEVFWLLFQLQQQARTAGGAVHLLLGNHETMVLYDDLRYVHPKYLEVARRFDLPHSALYGSETVIGAWLRTRPVMLRLGDTLFLHGGIAPESLDLVERIDDTNAVYRATLGRAKEEVLADPVSRRLYNGQRSPIWYRGYFDGDLSTRAVVALVERLGLARIVVGHTTMGEVVSFHDGRIIAIDSGIKRGESGQLLFIEGDGRISRGLLDGRREPVPSLQAAPEDND